jgi:exonuclease III
MAPHRGSRRRASDARPPPAAMRLRVGLHNLAGIWLRQDGTLQRLLAAWAKQRLDVVVLTETHATSDAKERELVQRLEAIALHEPSMAWEVRWARAQSSHAGVAILIRKPLLANHILTVQDVAFPAPATAPQASGRVCCVHMGWGGHRLQLLGAYLPATDQASREPYLAQVLPPYQAAARAAGHLPLWAGDWNFVECEALDRHQRRPAGIPPLPPQPTSTPEARRLAEACPGLVDVFRQRRPAAREYTFLRHTREGLQASRLDRFYVDLDLLDYVSYCGVPYRGTTSDHRMVVMEVLARRAPTHGPGLPRARTSYQQHADLHAQVETWLAEQQHAMPSEHAALLDWYPAFKREWLQRLGAVNREARRRMLEALEGRDAARAAVEVAAAALEQAQPPPGAEAAYREAYAAWEAACTTAGAAAARHQRQKWLHTRETPCPLITRLVRPGAAATAIPGLRCQTAGGTVTDPRVLPAVMADFWASLCSPPQPAPADRAAVLAAVHAHAGRLPPAQAATAGSPTLSAAEVRKAIRRLPPSSAPGPDGIPIAVLRKHMGPAAVILARVFTAVGVLHRTPADFLLGAITFFYKKGDHADPANYRPITLLGADYRVLTRALATRLGPAMNAGINRAQAAFLPGRRMGEAVWLLQLLPGLLRSRQESGVLAFLDFAKAYDTVDRSFLREVMEAMGAGEGLLQWVGTLLSDTHAMALVNGFPSGPVAFTAGVRQGCPLSPLLYLFVGEALLAWLTSRGHGLLIPGLGRLAGVQFADDFTALLASVQHVPALHADLQVFGRASGQLPNDEKCQVLLIGAPALPAQQAQGLPYRVVQQAKTLGVIFSNADLPPRQLADFWRERLQLVYQRYDKLSRLPLSIFGRAYCAAGYGLSRLLFHMEFMGLPPDELLADLERHTAALVDRAVSPLRWEPCLTGIPNSALPGPPAAGGSGLLPLRQHVAARHAWWALRLVTAPLRPESPAPWTCVARALITAVAPAASPLCLLTSMPLNEALRLNPNLLPMQPLPLPLSGPGKALAGTAFARLLNALHVLPPAYPRQAGLPTPGAWCGYAPVWGNPVLAEPATRLGLEWLFPRAFAAFPATSLRRLYLYARLFPHWPFDLASAVPLWRIRQQLLNAWAAVPQQWQAHARMCRLSEPEFERAAVDAQVRLLSALTIPPGLPLVQADAATRQACTVYLAHHRPRLDLAQEATVRMLTSMQPDEGLAARWPRLQAYLEDAQAPAGFDVPALLARLAALWRLPWDNQYKEPLWRLALNGLPMYGDQRFMKGRPAATCHCGEGPVGRGHGFWTCCVAQAVHASVCAAMRAAGSGPAPTLARHHLWLAMPPPGLHHGVWQVVALAALAAMNAGRRHMVGMCLSTPDEDEPPSGPSTGARLKAASRTQLLRACTCAEECFWARLADFISANPRAPSAWHAFGTVPTAHPFMHAVDGDGLALSPRPAVVAASVLPPAPVALPAP